MENETMTSQSFTSAEAALLNIHVYFPGDGEQTGDGLLEGLGAILKCAAPIAEKFGGQISRVSDAGIGILFESGCEKALNCAIAICTDGALRGDNKPAAEFTIGIHYGTVTMGTLGYGSFRTFIAVSADNAIARSLSRLAVDCRARILITEAASSRIRDFGNRYTARRLGLIHSKYGDAEINLYDVFEGDPTDSKYRKRRSKVFFEKGVELFLSGNYMQARSYFIELLKFDRNDGPAKEYVFKCDSYIADPQSADNSRVLATI